MTEHRLLICFPRNENIMFPAFNSSFENVATVCSFEFLIVKYNLFSVVSQVSPYRYSQGRSQTKMMCTQIWEQICFKATHDFLPSGSSAAIYKVVLSSMVTTY